jgi:hypothetical protein
MISQGMLGFDHNSSFVQMESETPRFTIRRNNMQCSLELQTKEAHVTLCSLTDEYKILSQSPFSPVYLSSPSRTQRIHQ